MYTFLTPDPITLEVRNASGEIKIILSDTPTTTVEVTAGTSHPLGFLDDVFKAFGGGRRFDGARVTQAAAPGTTRTEETPDLADLVRVQFTDGENATLIIDTDPARDGWRSSFDLTITAPSLSNVRVHAQSADLLVTGAAALLDARTASGDVSLERTTGKTLVQSASGDISIDVADGKVDIRTASGDVQLGTVADDALLHTTSGDISVSVAGGNVSARSVSGHVRVSDATAGQAEVNAVSGDVEIGVHAGSLASINLSTVSGNTDTEFEVTGDVPVGDSPVLEIKVKTTSGDIRLHRAA